MCNMVRFPLSFHKSPDFVDYVFCGLSGCLFCSKEKSAEAAAAVELSLRFCKQSIEVSGWRNAHDLFASESVLGQQWTTMRKFCWLALCHSRWHIIMRT